MNHYLISYFNGIYEDFYRIASESGCFKKYCVEAFGADFSQDGFSDLSQVDRIFQALPETECPRILDIGCGNGKMLRYLQSKTGAFISGFDLSENAIRTARTAYPDNAEFRVGKIGEIEYPAQSFDLIVSMDTLYFASDMAAFVGQVKRWLKPGGVFFIGYQEGDIMRKTRGSETTKAARALRANGFRYEVANITEQTYHMLRHKRETILRVRDDFENGGLLRWFQIVKGQTNSVVVPFGLYALRNARYLYTARQ